MVLRGEPLGLPIEVQQALVRYRNYKQFYVPAWSADNNGRWHVAEFTHPVTAHKTGLNRATVARRLPFAGWLLFHSCVVRFLARNDRRATAEP